MADQEPIRLGIIGAGAISQIVHLPIFAERRDVTLVAIADADSHKAETLSRRFSVPLVMEAEELLELEELDAVVLCTPNALHEEMAVAALGSGKHVLVERPLATTAAGATRVLEAADSAGRVLGVGLPHRYRPEVAALRSFVEGGELGRLYAARSSWLTRSFRSARSSWRDDPGSGGGALIDLGIPAIDLCLWVIGYPKPTRVSCVLTADEGGVEHSATLMVETEDAIAITIEVSNRLFASEDRYYLRVMGEDGSGTVPPLEIFKRLGGRPMEVTPRQGTPRGGENPYMNAYRRLLDDFVRCVTGVSSAPLPTEQIQVLSLIEAAYRAAERGQELEL